MSCTWDIMGPPWDAAERQNLWFDLRQDCELSRGIRKSGAMEWNRSTIRKSNLTIGNPVWMEFLLEKHWLFGSSFAIPISICFEDWPNECLPVLTPNQIYSEAIGSRVSSPLALGPPMRTLSHARQLNIQNALNIITQIVIYIYIYTYDTNIIEYMYINCIIYCII